MSNNLTFPYKISRSDKNLKNNHKSIVVWFFGLSGAGKSTLCDLVEQTLMEHHIKTAVLDGDSVRKGLNSDLLFSSEEREENLRRVSEIAKILVNNGLVTLCSFIAPLESHRKLINAIVHKDDILWIYVDTPLNTCIQRDPKGLYEKAMKGEISDFTGITSPFESPTDVDFQTHVKEDVHGSVEKISALILEKIKL